MSVKVVNNSGMVQCLQLVLYRNDTDPNLPHSRGESARETALFLKRVCPVLAKDAGGYAFTCSFTLFKVSEGKSFGG